MSSMDIHDCATRSRGACAVLRFFSSLPRGRGVSLSWYPLSWLGTDVFRGCLQAIPKSRIAF